MLVDNAAFIEDSLEHTLKVFQGMKTRLPRQLNRPAGHQRQRDIVQPFSRQTQLPVSLELLFQLLQRFFVSLICVEVGWFALNSAGQIKLSGCCEDPLQRFTMRLEISPRLLLAEMIQQVTIDHSVLGRNFGSGKSGSSDKNPSCLQQGDLIACFTKEVGRRNPGYSRAYDGHICNMVFRKPRKRRQLGRTSP
ncbi:hypothetical protein D3C75_908680 [compost metagenome]